MAVEAWWDRDVDERFWMEATTRPDLGEDLRAPKAGAAGQGVWHYELVSYSRPGDIVFHWHTQLFEHPALVRWSQVVGPLREEAISWTARAGSNRTDPPVPRPNWVQPLGGIHFLDRPIFIADLTAIRNEILAVRTDLQARASGPTYFPFNGYGHDSLRAAQAYLTKLPRALVELIDERLGLELEALRPGGLTDETRQVPVRPGTGQGFLQDTERRLAVERHAVARAVQIYEDLGATDIEILGKPYDLRLRLSGQEVHVDVKGSVNEIDAILVTKNELEHARTFPRVELVVVDGISWMEDGSGRPRPQGGSARRWEAWEPDEGSLTAMTFSHRLPDLP